jgi:hypothetical protein
LKNNNLGYWDIKKDIGILVVYQYPNIFLIV